MTRPHLSSDPRDKLYALVGIAHDAQDFPLDYGESTTAVYRSFAAYMIDTTNRLHTLCSAGTAFLDKKPSWVPNWSIDVDLPVESRAISWVCNEYYACRTKGLPTISASFHGEEDTHLNLAGKHLAMIKEIGPPL